MNRICARAQHTANRCKIATTLRRQLDNGNGLHLYLLTNDDYVPCDSQVARVELPLAPKMPMTDRMPDGTIVIEAHKFSISRNAPSRHKIFLFVFHKSRSSRPMANICVAKATRRLPYGWKLSISIQFLENFEISRIKYHFRWRMSPQSVHSSFSFQIIIIIDFLIAFVWCHERKSLGVRIAHCSDSLRRHIYFLSFVASSSVW